MRRCKYSRIGDDNLIYKCNLWPQGVPIEYVTLFCLNNCDFYTPVELDPYWKDIVDETNRRLYNAN